MNKDRLKPIPGFQNLRCLGGYANEQGQITRWDHSFRSDWQPEVSQASVQLLHDLGIKHVIDLRSDAEVSKSPNAIAECGNVAYHHYSLLPDLDPDTFYVQLEDRDDLLATLYIGMVEDAQDKIANVMRILSEAADDAVLFHCSAGKDRTGVIAALLLGIAGISHEHIVRDYTQSHTNIIEMVNNKLAEVPHDLPQDKRNALMTLFRSDAINMNKLLDHIDTRYGSVTQYLSHIGLRDIEMAQLRQRMY